MQLYTWQFKPDYAQEINIGYLKKGDMESLSMPTSQFLPMVHLFNITSDKEVDNIEDYVSIDWVYGEDGDPE